MKAEFDKLGIYNVDHAYLKYLHDTDNEVFYSENMAYDRKPFLGIVIGIGDYKYFIPLTSGKKSISNGKTLDWGISSFMKL